MSMLYVNSCCCTCLGTENLNSLQSRDSENVKLIDKLLFCLTEKDSIFECAPLLMCEKCNKMLQELYRFKTLGSKNLDLVRNCLKQLIRSPFANLTIENPSADNQIASGSAQIPTQNDNDQLQTHAIVKMEVVAEEDNENNQLLKQEQAQENNPEGVDPSLQNDIVKNYLNPMAQPSSSKSNPRRFSRHTMCKPCGKNFIRHDYYIKHILMCPKNDLKTKNSVLNWAEKNKKIVIKDQDSNNIDLANDALLLTKTSKKVDLNKQTNSSYIGIKKKRGKMERSVCTRCEKPVATAFMNRHHRTCKHPNKKRKKAFTTSGSSEKSETTEEESDDNSNADMRNTTI